MPAHELAELQREFQRIRADTERLAAPLSAEDQTVQSMADVSPTKWHRAHTTWFFETFVLKAFVPNYQVYHNDFAVLFNSYYEAIGPRHPRHTRGVISRPGIEEVARYRQVVDNAITTYLANDVTAPAARLIALGLHHEQQHQELLLMDIKHVLSCNPISSAYTRSDVFESKVSNSSPQWIDVPGGLVEIGFEGSGFSFDNESPRHQVWLDPYRISDRLVTCAEWRNFIDDGGYQRPELWLSDGWARCQQEGWTAPLYWEIADANTPGQPSGTDITVFTLGGSRALDLAAPVLHVSHYEADAYARWAGARLPTEAEWEHAVATQRGRISALHNVDDSRWQWTASPYIPYPGYQRASGAIGEYNGKFMANQMVLRGGSLGTPVGHTRVSYRNFYGPGLRWMFSGVRLAAWP